ncbi:carbohydrate kinase family protein [Pseudonocardia adelaidensis]|uniref:Sugar kinase n=1 Tax=Pseudonocardia adelaidensis TaxID=648754 RepID=A0ABP9NE09_9PSEU
MTPPRFGPRVVVVGDVAVDVLVEPCSPAVAGADVPARIRTRAGGAGANTAAWLAHLGADVTLVARVGDDPAGRAATDDLRAAGVRPALAVDPELPTCTVVVLLADGDRTMLSDRGAAARLAPADLPSVEAADHLHLSGYVLLGPASRAAGRAALARARAAGLSTSVDPQVAPALGAGFTDDVRGVDLLLPNAAELAALGGAEALRGVVGAVAATDGPAPARWTDRDGTRTAQPPPIEVVDPTGAGDAFDAGVLVAWLTGAGPAAALEAGCAARAAAVGRLGARPG